MEPSFEVTLRGRFPDLDLLKIAKIIQYRDLVLAENALQNLTRSTSVEDFVYSHVLDCVELLKSGFLKYPAVDLGSGMGVPGLLCSILDPKPWILAESEKSKAEFLVRTIMELDLKQVEVWGDRAEVLLRSKPVGCIVARAVGPVGRIFGWFSRCSTWNTLILLKSRGWAGEWAAFQMGFAKQPLEIQEERQYEAGPEKKFRTILRLIRK